MTTDFQPNTRKTGLFLGIFEGHWDPAVAIVHNGKVLAYSEEERHIRFKHAPRVYPDAALQYCLDAAGAKLEDIEAVGINWDMPAYGDGRMASFFAEMRQQHQVDSRTVCWQNGLLRRFHPAAMREYHENHWRQQYGDVHFPPLYALGHHYVHAFQSYMQSPYHEAIALTIDGSGDADCTVVWLCEGETIRPIRRIVMPHSLGWLYAAFTEYLGFEAYDGEYKVMGLAAYGSPNAELREKMSRIVYPAEDGVEYRIDPAYIHYGPRSYSERFTDKLVDLFGARPRLRREQITNWHQDIAYAVQQSVEEQVERLILWAIAETGVHNICIGGGVGLNIKMNSRLFQLDAVEDIFAHPLCSDGGAAQGAALAAAFHIAGQRPEKLRTLALGIEESDEAIEAVLRRARLNYERPPDICEAVAAELASGRVVGWVQGRMEAGPRSLGQRSILADPRRVENRDRVNEIIKFREFWRPFCPSMTIEAADRYFDKWTYAPFMILAFRANEALRREAPAVVHVDGTSRVQFVEADVLPRYHRLLTAFEKLTGVPALLNTSFNVKGEPIVATIHDALRTFWSTGMEVLAAGGFLVRKPEIETTPYQPPRAPSVRNSQFAPGSVAQTNAPSD
jgi:carbamoyltransferase